MNSPDQHSSSQVPHHQIPEDVQEAMKLMAQRSLEVSKILHEASKKWTLPQAVKERNPQALQMCYNYLS